MGVVPMSEEERMMMGRMMRTMVAAVAAGGLVLGTGTATRAEENQFAHDFGMGLGAAAANLLYTPAKVVYATLGGITGSFAYGLTGGNLDVARKVWTPSMGGTYIVTPGMLRSEEPVMFSGTTEPKRTEVAYSSAPQPAASGDETTPPARLTEEAPSEPFAGY